MEYEVLWGDGPLGLTLRPDLGEDMPPVVGRITRMDSAAALAKVAVGHMLVSINGVDTARQGYDNVVDLLQKISRPATLRFRVPRAFTPDLSSGGSFSDRGDREHSRSRNTPSSSSSSDAYHISRSKREQYTVVWTEGPLGMILRPDDEDVHVACIRKITGKGAGTGMERASVGDILVAINGQETKSLGFRNTISLLKTIRKPAVLKFKRMGRRLSRKRLKDDALIYSTSFVGDETEGGARVSSQNDAGVYDIIWREGELGLKLKPNVRDVPVISRLTGKGTASGLHNANIGDELLTVNRSPVEGETYQDTLRLLKHSPKPAVLRFKISNRSRVSLMSVASTRSNPSTVNEVSKAMSHHVPIYDSDRIDPSSKREGSRERDRNRERDREREKEREWEREQEKERYKLEKSRSGRKKPKKRLPLDVAKELVAAFQGVDIECAYFAGMLLNDIQDGTREAHLLRVEAKACITGKAEKNSNGVPAKVALSRAEDEAKVLAQALKKVKEQAKKYEQILKGEQKEKILGPALGNKPKSIVGLQNDVIAELSGVISGFRRDSYSDMEVIPMVRKNQEMDLLRQSMISDLEGVASIPLAVPATNYCAECGATEKESKLDRDEDGEFYCVDCWEKYNGVVQTVSSTSTNNSHPLQHPPSLNRMKSDVNHDNIQK
jgi:hypothetical protein